MLLFSVIPAFNSLEACEHGQQGRGWTIAILKYLEALFDKLPIKPTNSG